MIIMYTRRGLRRDSKKEALISKGLLWEDKVRYKSQKVANVHSLHSW